MKDTNNKTDKNKEEHCYYSGLPSPMAYTKEESDEEDDTSDKKEQHNNKPPSKNKKPNIGFMGQKP